MKKLSLITAFAFWVFAFGACGQKKDGPKVPEFDVVKLYKINCALCHGEDGKLGANGSKDLTASPLTLEERVAIISNGKGNMTAFQGKLPQHQIEALAAYTFEL